MSKICQLSGKTAQTGNRVSHSKTKTNHRFDPNLQKKRVFIAEIGKTVTIEVSARGLKTIKKNGAYATLLKAGLVNAK